MLNYVTAYQMLHRSAQVRLGQRMLIHGAAGEVGSALLQLGRLAGLEMYGTCSARGALAVSELGGIPIDYQHQDFVNEIDRLTGEGVEVVFESIGGTHIWRVPQGSASRRDRRDRRGLWPDRLAPWGPPMTWNLSRRPHGLAGQSTTFIG